LLQSLWTPDGNAVEVLAVDEGPGMADVGRCLQDGYSTGGTPGSGLGAVRRLSAEFDLYSSQPHGTVILARVYADPHADRTRSPVSWGAVSLPARGEQVCGDTWQVAAGADAAAVIVADGLGHGPLAMEASQTAARVFGGDPFRGPAQTLEAAHREMGATRGAAVAAAHVDYRSGVLRYSGVGNIAGFLLAGDGGRRGLLSHNGIVGSGLKTARELDYPWPPNGLLVMHSDGLLSRWTLDPYPKLLACHPGVMAAVLARDFVRGRDDASVVVLRFKASQP
jgi:hypothetical protein